MFQSRKFGEQQEPENQPKLRIPVFMLRSDAIQQNLPAKC